MDSRETFIALNMIEGVGRCAWSLLNSTKLIACGRLRSGRRSGSQSDAMWQENLEIRLICCSCFRLRQNCRRCHKAVEPRTSPPTVLVEQIRSQRRLGPAKWDNSGLQNRFAPHDFHRCDQAVEEFCPRNGACGQGMTVSQPTVHILCLLRTLYQQSNEVIRIEVNHAGRHFSAASRSSRTSVRYR